MLHHKVKIGWYSESSLDDSFPQVMSIIIKKKEKDDYMRHTQMKHHYLNMIIMNMIYLQGEKSSSPIENIFAKNIHNHDNDMGTRSSGDKE